MNFIEDYHSPWKLIFSHHLEDYGDKFLLHCNYDVADLPKSLPKFYRECFEAWAALTKKQPTSCDHVIEQILWNNNHIRIDDKPQFCKSHLWLESQEFKDIILSHKWKIKTLEFFLRKRS